MEFLKNKNGTPIAQLRPRGDGSTGLHTVSGGYLGRFDPRNNRTYGPSGDLIGQGNLLATLIKPR